MLLLWCLLEPTYASSKYPEGLTYRLNFLTPSNHENKSYSKIKFLRPKVYTINWKIYKRKRRYQTPSQQPKHNQPPPTSKGVQLQCYRLSTCKLIKESLVYVGWSWTLLLLLVACQLYHRITRVPIFLYYRILCNIPYTHFTILNPFSFSSGWRIWKMDISVRNVKMCKLIELKDFWRKV